MAATVDPWTVAQTIGMAAIAAFTFLSNRKAAATQAKVVETQDKVAEVKKIVDGPLSLALESNARLAARVSALLPEDAAARQAAIEAAALDQNRKAGKEARIADSA